MRGISSEVIETVPRRRIDKCCVQECRWRGASARMLEGKDCCYKFIWVSNEPGAIGGGVFKKEIILSQTNLVSGQAK